MNLQPFQWAHHKLQISGLFQTTSARGSLQPLYHTISFPRRRAQLPPGLVDPAPQPSVLSRLFQDTTSRFYRHVLVGTIGTCNA